MESEIYTNLHEILMIKINEKNLFFSELSYSLGELKMDSTTICMLILASLFLLLLIQVIAVHFSLGCDEDSMSYYT